MLRLIFAVWLVTVSLFGSAATHVAKANALFGKDVTATHLGGQFEMTDQNGKRRQLSDFRGKVVVIFFGYTRCPDVCPTTLSRMSQVLSLLGPQADKTQVLWVTVDPERDTTEILHNYVPAFNPAFIALRGSQKETEALARKFDVGYTLLPYQGTVLVDHSAEGYLIDTTGKTRVKLPYDMTAEQIAADIRRFLPHD